MSRIPEPTAVLGTLVLAAVLGLLGPDAGAAQQVPAERDDVRTYARAEAAAAHARIDSLLPLLEAARLGEAAEDSARAARAAARVAELDSVRVGPFALIGTKGRVAEAAPAFAAAYTRLRPLGQSVARTVAGRTFVLQRGLETDVLRTLQTRPRTIQVWTGFGDPERAAASAIGSAVASALPEEARGWLGGMPVAISLPTDQWRAIRWRLTLSAADAAERCYRGDPQACWAAMSPDGGAGWSRWYTPEQIRGMVSRTSDRFGAPPQELRRACLQDADAAACRRYLADSPPPPPLDEHARASLLAFALQRGGAGALDRLIAADGALPQRLAAAAGTGSPDRLILDWRAHVLEAEPRRAASPGGVLMLLVWIGVLATLAGRSTRWRLG